MVEVRALEPAGLVELRPRRFEDSRGWFAETWSERRFAELGLDFRWVQDNHVFSKAVGTVRALHFQRPPMAQAKLVRAVRGAVFDVAVDIRRGSPDFGRWTAVTLSAEAGNALLVPRGFAHGYVTLTPEAEVLYKVDAPYSPDHEQVIAWDDPAIGIDWPRGNDPIINDRDREAPWLADCDTGFTFP